MKYTKNKSVQFSLMLSVVPIADQNVYNACNATSVCVEYRIESVDSKNKSEDLGKRLLVKLFYLPFFFL